MSERRARRRAPEVLDLPAPRAVRLVAGWLADEVETTRGRLRVGDDRDAVHDLRVALRRLRSWVRAWRGELRGSHPRRAGRALSRLADMAGVLRDREVLRELLASVEKELAPKERAGARRLAASLRDAPDARVALADDVDAGWAPLRVRLLEAWSVYDARMRVDGRPADPPMSERLADSAHAHGRSLASALASADDGPEAAHAARIAGKRLRYLLEPFEAQEPAVTPVLERLRDLQKELGELNDLAMLERAAADYEPSAGDDEGEAASDVVPSRASRRGRPRDPQAGIDAVRRLAGERAAELRKPLARAARDATAPLLDAVDALADHLRARAAADVEIERKYLLRALPPEVRGAPVVEMSQGYVPGRKLVERLRHVRGPDGERWYRTVKLGRGMARAEFEEETTRDVFEAMWPLTRGRRVTKRRYEVRDGAHTWEVDDFTDRVLVLAEVELRSETEEVEPPAWLGPYVVREVTGEGTYQNSKLAK